MIIANDVLSKMDADELRNYVAHLHEEIHMMPEMRLKTTRICGI